MMCSSGPLWLLSDLAAASPVSKLPPCLLISHAGLCCLQQSPSGCKFVTSSEPCMSKCHWYNQNMVPQLWFCVVHCLLGPLLPPSPYFSANLGDWCHRSIHIAAPLFHGWPWTSSQAAEWEPKYVPLAIQSSAAQASCQAQPFLKKNRKFTFMALVSGTSVRNIREQEGLWEKPWLSREIPHRHRELLTKRPQS